MTDKTCCATGCIEDNILQFRSFPKISRLYSDVTITEKIDGTNGLIYIDEDNNIRAGSRHTWLSPGNRTDNFGFAQWVKENRDELLRLGRGYHYGEWYGKGINRGYGLEDRRFALFNTDRWQDGSAEKRPRCCGVVKKIVDQMDFSSSLIDYALDILDKEGSITEKGFMNPEGIVIRWERNGYLLKMYCLRNTDK